ncbi:MAG: Eco57I restriction-modification methylase domain-containing protein [Thermoplasmatota archaeon]
MKIPDPQPETILEKLNNIHEKCKKDRDISEDKLKSYFHKSGILEELGYEDEDIHIEETVKAQKRTDIHVTDDYGNVKAVIEFKKPTVSKLGDHFDQLWDRYVIPLKAEYGLLYNGFELYVYERIKEESDIIFGLNVLELKKEHSSNIIYHLEKPRYNLTQIKEVSEYLKKFEDPEEKLNLKDEASREHFFENFKLKKHSAFGEMVKASIKLFNSMEDEKEYSFLGSAYDFWKTSYAKKPEEIPENWRPIMEDCGLNDSQGDLYKFMFCLETTYALFTRLILAKSAEDYEFADVKFVGFLENKIADASRRGDIPRASWGKMTQELIRDMKNTLVSSVFEEDIFYWWTEPFEEQTYNEMYFTSEVNEVTHTSDNFGDGIRDILLTFCKFDFSEIKGDPLGILYQRYFDKKTRKALGEFYTPQEVVDYILDSVDYKGRKVLEKRLLDPACGSGTFLVTALQRYLEASEKEAKKKGWDTILDNLCDKYRIVGFDIHPFATIMAQIQFMLVLLPYYKKAVDDNKKFVLMRVPIFRTDSLKDESQSGKISLQDFENGKKISMNVKLPVQEEKGGFFEESFSMPHSGTVLRNTDIHNNEEYFGALQGLFDVVKNQAKKMENKNEILEFSANRYKEILKKRYLSDKNWSRISSFFESFGNELLKKINLLQSEFDDGRLIKSIEDVFLASLLKNEQKYDYIVENPPYVRTHSLSKSQKKYYKDNYSSAYGQYDIYVLFMERSIQLLKEEGKFGIIVSSKFTSSHYGKKIREFILENTEIKEMIDVSSLNIFKDASVYPFISIFKKQKNEYERNNNKIVTAMKPLEKDFYSRQMKTYQVSQKRYQSNEDYLFDLLPEEEYKVINKMKKNSDRLGNIAEITRGFRPPPEELLYESKEENTKPLITGEEMSGAYQIEKPKNYIDYKPKKIHESKPKKVFEDPKIMVRDIGLSASAYFDDSSLYCLKTIYLIRNLERDDISLKHLTAFLNSIITDYFFRANFLSSHIGGGYLRFRTQYLEQIPIPKKINEGKSKNLLKFVEQIEEIHKKKKDVDNFPMFYLSNEEISKKTLKIEYRHKNIRPNVQKTQDGMYGIIIGERKKEDPILVDTEEKAGFVEKALKEDSVRKGEKIEILVPKSNKVVKEILEEYRKDKQKLDEMPPVEELEEEINQIVYDLYDLDDKDIEVIENFLEKF